MCAKVFIVDNLQWYSDTYVFWIDKKGILTTESRNWDERRMWDIHTSIIVIPLPERFISLLLYIYMAVPIFYLHFIYFYNCYYGLLLSIAQIGTVLLESNLSIYPQSLKNQIAYSLSDQIHGWIQLNANHGTTLSTDTQIKENKYLLNKQINQLINKTLILYPSSKIFIVNK